MEEGLEEELEDKIDELDEEFDGKAVDEFGCLWVG